jgi:hypothetical protein
VIEAGGLTLRSFTAVYSCSIWHGKAVQPTREAEAHGVFDLVNVPQAAEFA